MRFILHPNTETSLYKASTFPGGEPHIKLNASRLSTVAVLSIQVQVLNVPLLAVTVDAIRRVRPDIDIQLFLPYFPGARQDRVCEEGEALTASVYARLINALGFSKVIIMDPHSDVAPALIDRCRTIPHGVVYESGNDLVEVLDFYYEGLDEEDEPLVVAPDAGATKKVLAAIKRSTYADRFTFAQGGKVRDTKTGTLTHFTFEKEHVRPNQPVIIMDDLNCRGGTFIGLAKLLRERGAEHVTLFTTHADLATGIRGVLSNGINKVITTNSEDDHGTIVHEGLHVFDVFGAFRED